jgi:hypothetical protein
MAINGLALGTNNISAQLATKLDIAGGKVLQVVRATDTTSRNTTSTSFADASISVTITPQKSTSSIILIWSFRASSSTARTVSFQIADSSNVGISGAEDINHTFATGYIGPFSLFAYATTGSTSAATFKGRFAAGATNTLTVQNNLATGQLFAIEVSA